jgi:hypothetical protein
VARPAKGKIFLIHRKLLAKRLQKQHIGVSPADDPQIAPLVIHRPVHRERADERSNSMLRRRDNAGAEQSRVEGAKRDRATALRAARERIYSATLIPPSMTSICPVM